MTGAERFILIGCLLQGALGRQWAVWMPPSIEALSGSCVLIPCRFEIIPDREWALRYSPSGQWFRYRTKVFDSSSQSDSHLQGKITGDLEKKNCTTVLENLPISYDGHYYFRFEGPYLSYTFQQAAAQINIKDSPTKPKLIPEELEVTEGTSVNLSCSAAAPCPKLPPNLTWTPRLSDSVDQLQENEDQTKSVSSVLIFTASHNHHEQKITCRALYTLQQGGIQMTSEASLTLTVLYPPKSTSVSVSPSGSVFEGSSVTLTCSSKANPPVQNYTWYKVNGTEINTVGTGQNLTFNVTESNGSEQYYCEAQNQHGKENSTPVQLNVIYMPRISGSGSCSRTAAEISCSCESRGNPSPSMEWRVSGLRVTNSADRVIREEQLGNTSLRSSLTMRQSQGDTPTVLCISTNSLGSSGLQLHVPSSQRHSDLHSGSTHATSLLIGAVAGAGAMMIICLIMQLILKKKRNSQCSGTGRMDNEGLILTDGAAQDEESDYANKTMLSNMGALERGEEPSLHYATVDFSKLHGAAGEQATGIIRGMSKRTSDYAVIRHKSREENKGGEEEDEEAQGKVQKEGQAELGTERETAKSCLNLSPQASINPEPSEDSTYGNICRSRPTKKARQGQQQQQPENSAGKEEQEEQLEEENPTGGQKDMYVDIMSPLTEDSVNGTGESEYAEVRKLK